MMEIISQSDIERHLAEFGREHPEIIRLILFGSVARGDAHEARDVDLDIGEAANRLGEDLEAPHPTIPWRQMAGMRNRLIHGYDDVDASILWRIINDDLPKLLAQVESILEKSS